MQRKKKTRFQKITMVAIWLMLIAMLGSLIFGAVASLNIHVVGIKKIGEKSLRSFLFLTFLLINFPWF